MNDEQNINQNPVKPIPAEEAETPAEQTAQAAQSSNPQDLETALKQIEELTNISKRAMADLANYRKRVEDEKAQFIRFATGGVFLEILPLYDSLERAMVQIPEDIKENEWVKGITNIKLQFEQIMDRAKIAKMKTVGQKFDPNFHEAVSQGNGEKDIILEELESGYTIENQTLRPAKVKVGNGEAT